MNIVADVSGKRILLVGATGVLGREYASTLAANGANLVIADRSTTDIKSFAEEINTLSSYIDVSSEQSVIECIEYCSSQLGGLDGVINNAAATSEGLMNSGDLFANFEEYPLNLWNETINVNLTGAFLVARESGKLMKASSNCGSLVNISSIYGVVGPDHRIYENQQFKSFPGYSASKAGVIGLTKWLATWWGESVRVNCVTPGGVFNNHNNEFVKAYSNRVPLQRMANRNELSGIVLYLLSDSSSYVTGQNFIIDGGMTAW
jgi:NAD(P)-dependent dehydrogenase (short-subunit alcohol dehydrogenase family)